jgi:hypothetical protein
LAKVAGSVVRRTAKPLSAAQIGQKVGRGVNRYKVAKHFALEIADNHLLWSRKADSIAREKALDGVYIIRTSEPANTLNAEDAVRAYKQLGDVEKAFRTFKGLDLRVRPIHHRLETRVRAHLFLCMLAYYVEWHMRQALAPLLFVEENLAQARAARDPVAKAMPSESAQAKKNSKLSQDGLPLRHFDGLLSVLATLCSNTCRVGEGKHATRFQRPTEASPHQREAFRLLDNVFGPGKDWPQYDGPTFNLRGPDTDQPLRADLTQPRFVWMSEERFGAGREHRMDARRGRGRDTTWSITGARVRNRVSARPPQNASTTFSPPTNGVATSSMKWRRTATGSRRRTFRPTSSWRASGRLGRRGPRTGIAHGNGPATRNGGGRSRPGWPAFSPPRSSCGGPGDVLVLRTRSAWRGSV